MTSVAHETKYPPKHVRIFTLLLIYIYFFSFFWIGRGVSYIVISRNTSGGLNFFKVYTRQNILLNIRYNRAEL